MRILKFSICKYCLLLQLMHLLQQLMFFRFLHPITYGNYPQSMRAVIGNRLPTFTAAQSKMLIESIDFIGMNYYTSNYASPALTFNKVNLSYTTDNHLILSSKCGKGPKKKKEKKILHSIKKMLFITRPFLDIRCFKS